MSEYHTPHGERRTYRQGCRCLPCRLSNAKYKAELTTPRSMDAGPVIAHLKFLASKNVGSPRVGELTGIHPTHIADIRRGRYRRIYTSLANKILAITRPVPALGRRISSAKTWRQIKWLQAEGFTTRTIAERIGKKSLTPQPRITVRFAARIDALFNEMHE